MRKGIALAGNLILDQIKYVDSYPTQNTLTTISDIKHAIGGLVCNCAIDIARLAPDIPLKAVGIVGNDDMGGHIINEMKKYPSIDITRLKQQGQTSFTDVMTEPDGNRTFFQFRGANAYLSPEDFNFNSLEADILHIGYILLLDTLDGPDPEYETAMCRVLDMAQKAGIKTSVDVVSEESARFERLVPPALRYADYCIINEIEAQRTTGICLVENGGVREENFVPCMEKIAEMGVSRWVLIHTPAVSYGLDVKSAKAVRRESWPIPRGYKKSSVGAGDAFASGILLGAYNGWSLEKSIDTAGAVAACSLSGHGASDALKPLAEVFAEMEQYKKP